MRLAKAIQEIPIANQVLSMRIHLLLPLFMVGMLGVSSVILAAEKNDTKSEKGEAVPTSLKSVQEQRAREAARKRGKSLLMT